MRTQSSVRKHVANTAILKAWEQFTDSGELGSKAVRKVIGQRWIKSKELGIPIDIEQAPTVITADEIQEMQRTEPLVVAGKNALKNLEYTFSNTEHVAVLADANSRIIYSAGHKPIQEQLEKINFRPGADWSEELVGPNGIGTSLSLRRPEIVMGYEHYCESWQPWVCYGAPIFGASGLEIKGTIDITGPVEKTSQESMAMAISLAQSISANLAVEQYRNRDRLRVFGKRLLQRWASNCVLILDKSALIVDYNSRAAVTFNTASNELLNVPLTSVLPETGNFFNGCVGSKRADSIEIHHQDGTRFSETMTIDLEPIKEQDELLGFAAVIKLKSQSLLLPEITVDNNTSFQAIGDELIAQTLENTHYNISKAAKILGIDRSTIYRRMRKRTTG
ncbi:MAG: helix-turn-helix domain-containing protein [Gammaproteobacteria bacterium]